MSPLAKVFVVINLILGVAFFGSSATLFATRVNWREEALRFKKESDDRLKEIEDKYKSQGTRLQGFSEQLARLNTDFNSLSADKNKLQTNLVEVKGQLSTANVRIDTEVKEKTQLNLRLQDLEKRSTDLAQLVESVRKEADDAKSQKEVAVTEMTRRTLDLDKANQDYSKQLVEYTDLKSKADQLQYIVTAAQKQGINTDLIDAPPPIDAVVQAVSDPAESLVVLSVGREQKVQEGFKFTVYRGDRFVGKVQVIKVYEDLAGARILFTQENESIQVGDKAATQL